MKMFSWKDIDNLLADIPSMRKKDSIAGLAIAASFLSEKLKVFYGRQEDELGEDGEDEGEDTRPAVH